MNKEKTVSSDVQISSCTTLIQSGKEPTKNRAIAYIHRGNVYRVKGDYDRAIADLDKAITLDPKSVAAYISRGHAYQGKSDLDRSIIDYNKAIILDPKFRPPDIPDLST